MAALDQFRSRFGGQPLGQYNPFVGAPSYTSGYTPGAFLGLPGAGTPVAPGQPGVLTPPGGGGGGGQGQGIAPGTGGQGNPGWGPGRSDTAALIGAGLGMAIPGAGTLVGLGNAAAGLQAASQQDAATGLPMSFGDDIYAATGIDAFASPSIYGRGGYGDYGVNPGGSAGALNMEDPGVMGAARAQAASQVNQMNPAGPIAPATGVLSSAPAAPAGGVLSAPAAPALSQAEIKAAKTASNTAIQKAIQSLPQEERYGAAKKMQAAYDKSIANAMASGGVVTASQVKLAQDIAQKGLSTQQGKSGVSGSQISGGKTVGNNPNDRSGRNPGAPSGAGAGGRLGGGV